MRIPPRARPFIRLAAVAFIVVVADALTEQLTRGGGTLGFPLVTVLRIAVSLSILRYPLAGFVLSLEVDKWDWFWLGMAQQSAAQQAVYQEWDKAVDLVCLGIAAIVVLKWPDRYARNLALGTFAWRVIGVAALFVTGQRWLLIVFPNVFESVFLLYLIFRVLSGHELMLERRFETLLVTIALLIPKVGVEYFLHARNNRPWHMFRVLPDSISSPQAEAWLWGGIIYALPLLVLVLLVLNAEGRHTRGDPEVQVSV